MSNLSFIPSATASKPAQDFKQPSLFQKNSFETGANSFDQFMKNVKENQFETKQSPDRSERSRPAEIKAKQYEPDRDHSVSQSPKPKATPALADGEKTDSSQLQALNNEDQEIATKGQEEEVQHDETPAVANQEELLALLAHLAETEAVIRGETMPETVQMAELAEVMANVELTEANQGVTVSEIGLEIPVINAVKVSADDLKLNPETSTQGKTVDLVQLTEALPLMSGNASQADGESLFNQGQNSETVKNTPKANLVVEDGSQVVNKMAFDVNSISQKVEVEAQLGKDRVLAHGQADVKDGKVNLAVIQTHLAVNDAPDAKADLSALNAISAQPSVNNQSQLQRSDSVGVGSANKEELFSQIVEHAKVVINNGGSEMEVNLKPEHLGKLQLKVTIENEVVTAKFVAESQQVKEIIESNLGQLKRNLQENGMQVDTIMVSVGNHQADESFEQAANNQDGFGHSKGSAGTSDEDLDLAFEDSTPLAQIDTVIDLIA